MNRLRVGLFGLLLAQPDRLPAAGGHNQATILPSMNIVTCEVNPGRERCRRSALSAEWDGRTRDEHLSTLIAYFVPVSSHQRLHSGNAKGCVRTRGNANVLNG
jgi:hypothetical protein